MATRQQRDQQEHEQPEEQEVEHDVEAPRRCADGVERFFAVQQLGSGGDGCAVQCAGRRSVFGGFYAPGESLEITPAGMVHSNKWDNVMVVGGDWRSRDGLDSGEARYCVVESRSGLVAP